VVSGQIHKYWWRKHKCIVAKVTGRAKIQNEKKEMRKRGKRAPGIE
jgi:hypothetical protein